MNLAFELFMGSLLHRSELRCKTRGLEFCMTVFNGLCIDLIVHLFGNRPFFTQTSVFELHNITKNLACSWAVEHYFSITRFIRRKLFYSIRMAPQILKWFTQLKLMHCEMRSRLIIVEKSFWSNSDKMLLRSSIFDLRASQQNGQNSAKREKQEMAFTERGNTKLTTGKVNAFSLMVLMN